MDENVFLDVPPEFELFTNIKKIFVKEFIGIYFLIIRKKHNKHFIIEA